MKLADVYADPILDRLDDGTLIRYSWTGIDLKGRATVCLLTALVPACGEAKSAAVCPADVMPGWLAQLTPWLDDSGTDEAWPGHVREYARLVPHFGRLTAEPGTGRRALIGSLRAIIGETVTHGDPDGVVSAVLALFDRELAGDRPTETEYQTAAANAANITHTTNTAAAYAAAAANATDATDTADTTYATDAATYAVFDSADVDRVIPGILAAIADALGVSRV